MKMLFGGLLLAIGGLIAMLSGLCSAWILIATLGSGSGSEALGMTPMVAIVGGIPFAIGAGLFLWGRSLIRSARNDERY
jgi:hypothetical protein